MQHALAAHQHRLAVSRAARRALGDLPRPWCDGGVLIADGASPLSPADAARSARQADRDRAALIFVGEMYGVQLDHLAALLEVSPRRAAALVARWRAGGAAEVAVLSAGPRWVWLTRAGLATCGLPFAAGEPGLSRLAHLRAVTAARLALTTTPQFAAGGGRWRSERRLRARVGGRIGLREHVPDGEVLWPDGTGLAWAGESWAIEAELTPKTAARTVTIMRELLGRTGEYGCLAADVQVSGRPARHDRVIYLCDRAALPVVTRARDALGPLGRRVEIRLLPADAALAGIPAAAPAESAR